MKEAADLSRTTSIEEMQEEMEALSFVGDLQSGFNQSTEDLINAEPGPYLSSGLTHVTEFFSIPNPADSYAGPDSGDDYRPITDEDVLPLYLGCADSEDIFRTPPWVDSEGPEEIIAESKHGIEEVWCMHDLVLDYVPLVPDYVTLDLEVDSVLVEAHYVPFKPESHYVPLEPESHYVPLEPESHYVPLEPHNVPLEPEYVALELDSVPLGPESVPLVPDSVPLGPESVPLGPESVLLVPDYVPLELRYAPPEPHYVALKSDSVALVPDYVPLKPDYGALELDCVALERDFVPPDLSRSLTRSRWPSYRMSHPASASLRAEVPVAKDIRFEGVSKKKGKYGCEIRISKRIQQEKKSTIKKVWLGTFDTPVQAARALDVGKYFFKVGTHKKYFDPRIEALLSTISKPLQAEPLDALVVIVQDLAKHYGYHGTLP